MGSMTNVIGAAGPFLARAAVVAVAVGVGAPLIGAAVAAPDAGNGTATGEDAAAEILGAKSPVRVFLTAKSDQVRLPDGTLSALRPRHTRIDKDVEPVVGNCVATETDSSAPPAADWADPGFDDSSWPMTLAPVHTSRRRMYGLLCARLSFMVNDPAATEDLKLSLAYRGGVVVYLNGRELSRGHMPEGDITPDTPALDYPEDASLAPNGKLMRMGWGDPQKYEERFALRNRRHEVAVPANRLESGVNVLALELHRPLFDPAFYSAGSRRGNDTRACEWETLNLQGVKLTAAEPLTHERPAGLRVWNAPPADRLRCDLLADAFEPLRPVRICGCRNGGFCGVLMAGSTEEIEGLRAVIGELTGPGGTLPAQHVQVRLGLPDGVGGGWFDSLEETPPASIPARDGVASCPVWIDVSVPADQAPGLYKGTIAVSAEGAEPISVPLEITVADWTLPEATESQCWFWLVQSPESMAKAYDVPMWSDEHLALVGRSFDLMREVGTRIIYVPLFRHSTLGNEHSMIRWYQEGGEWKCDFSVFDKYLDTAVRHLNKLDVVCIHAWGRMSGGAYFGQKEHEIKGQPFPYTRLDPATGKLSDAEGPTWDEAGPIRAFLKPAFDGIRERLGRPGIAPDALLLGTGHDVVPSPACQEALKDVSGTDRWVYHCHSNRDVAYLAHVWGSPTPDKDIPRDEWYGWKEDRYYATFPRDGSSTVGSLKDYTSPLAYRASLESAGLSGLHGFGWCGADFWPVLEDQRGRLMTILDMHMYDYRKSLAIGTACTRLLGRGNNGPVPTARQRMARASLQEVEARAFIDRVLIDPAKEATLGADLVKRCERLLAERRTRLIRSRTGLDGKVPPNEIFLLQFDLETEAGRLFALAGEVAAKLEAAGNAAQ